MVSIIVVAFNASEFLGRCMESLVNQTFKDIEVIAVDDGSTDSTFEIMCEFANRYSTVKVFSQTNQGVSAARNLGMSKVLGEFITFIDADDWVDAEHIERLVQEVSARNIDGCICGYYLEYPNNKSKKVELRSQILSGKQAFEGMLYTDKFQGFLWNKLFKSCIIKENSLKFDERLYYMEDLTFCAEYFNHCSSLKCIQYVGCHYSQHSKSITGIHTLPDSEAIRKRETAISALNKVMDYCQTKMSRRLCRARIQTEYAEMLRVVCENCEAIDFFLKYERKMRRGLWTTISSPLHMKVKIRLLLTALFPKSFSRYMIKRQQRRF